MIYDWHARHRVTNRQGINDVTNGQNEFQWATADTRVRLLAQATATGEKSYAQTGERNRAAGLKQLLHARRDYDQLIDQRLRDMERLGLRSPDVDVARLPIGSWFLTVSFTLAKPYVSMDDEAFYIIDNPVKKEKVFRVPYVAAPTWKGHLREALRLGHGWQDDSVEMRALFGNAREADDDFCAGRLGFFPTYFNRIDLEVINPHSRHTGSGTLPIYFEVVPTGSTGAFNLLYVPFDQLGEPDDAPGQSARTLFEPLVQGISFLLLDLGVAAKKSSGFGVARPDSVTGQLRVNDPRWSEHDREWCGFDGLQRLATAWQEVVP